MSNCFSICPTTNVSSGGTLAGLMALGAADMLLSANPDYTFWRHRIKRCTNFQMENVVQTFQSQVSWGGDLQATLNRVGDLISHMYIVIDLPGIFARSRGSFASGSCGASIFPCGDRDDYACDPCGDGAREGCCACADTSVTTDSTDPLSMNEYDLDQQVCNAARQPFAYWINAVGYYALNCVRITIGGQVIDTLTGHFMDIWDELSTKPGKSLDEMVGRYFTVDQLIEVSKCPRTLYVPLPFWFTRHTGNALPMVSLQFHSVQIHVSVNALQRMIVVSDCDVEVLRCDTQQPISTNDIGMRIDALYVYLDIEERDQFATGSFQHLIHQTQYTSAQSRGNCFRTQLNFNHPVKALLWTARRLCQINANNPANLSGKWGKEPIQRASLKVNNMQRFDREGEFFRKVQPHQHFTKIPHRFIYAYSFAILPEDCNPSGSLNFSRLDNVEFEASIDPATAAVNSLVNSTGDVLVTVMAINWNSVKYREGLGGLTFAS